LYDFGGHEFELENIKNFECELLFKILILRYIMNNYLLEYIYMNDIMVSIFKGKIEDI
jgi:hypothetical protein